MVAQRLDAVEKRSGIKARLLVNGLIELTPAVEEGMYRIAQEALNNSLKHAKATAVTVTLQQEAKGVRLEIADNGQGLNPDQLDDKGGMGLENIRERARRLNGRVDIESEPDKGTAVRVLVSGKEAP